MSYMLELKKLSVFLPSGAGVMLLWLTNTTKTMTIATTKSEQESLANAKKNMQQQCMFEGQLQTKSKLTNPSN